MENSVRRERYDSLDGIRAWSCICIVMAHIYLNASYALGDGFEKFALFAVELVFLYMIISGFSVCCGYFEGIKNGSISVVRFYGRRYAKVLPFWSLLIILEVLLSPGKETLYEAFADITLLFGLLPNPAIEVIGVGWFLGVVFVFYLVFPFLCFVLKSKLGAWCALGGSIIYHLLCIEYFFDRNHMPVGYYARTNFLYCMMFFVAGCILYLYRSNIAAFVKKYKIVCWLILPAVTLVFLWKDKFCKQEYTYILLLVVWCCYAAYGIGATDKLFNNKFVKVISKYSLEIYLSHMVVFRVLERIGLLYLFGNDTTVKRLLSYVVTFLIVMTGTFCFSWGVTQCMQKAGAWYKHRKK